MINVKKNARIVFSSIFFLAAAAALFFVLIWRESRKECDFEPEYAFVTMDTWCSAVLKGEEEACRSGYKRIEEVFRRVEQAADIFDADSELSRINSGTTAGARFELSPELAGLFRAAQQAYYATEGIFDPSVLPLLELYKRGHFTEAERAAAAALTGWEEAAVLDNDTLLILKDGVKFDFGGIAKGYALDLAAAECGKTAGIRSGIINAGGNITVIGVMETEVAFADPDMPESNGGRFLLSGGRACASSGDYRRGQHIIDISKGEPAFTVHGVTVIAPTATEADFWSTTLFIKPDFKLPDHITGIIPDGSGGFRTINTGEEVLLRK